MADWGTRRFNTAVTMSSYKESVTSGITSIMKETRIFGRFWTRVYKIFAVYFSTPFERSEKDGSEALCLLSFEFQARKWESGSSVSSKMRNNEEWNKMIVNNRSKRNVQRLNLGNSNSWVSKVIFFAGIDGDKENLGKIRNEVVDFQNKE